MAIDFGTVTGTPWLAKDSMSMTNKPAVIHGDCLQVLAAMPSCSVDSVVCDPPYGLTELRTDTVTDVLTKWLTGDRAAAPTSRGFMGKSWDAFVPPPAVWDECLRVLKPGGYLLAFSAPRTVDLMQMSIRLAGFRIRDSIVWEYGQGNPKGLNLGKEIQARATTGQGGPKAQRKAALGDAYKPTPLAGTPGYGITGNFADRDTGGGRLELTDPEAVKWSGWNTGLKPATEPIVVAQKPMSGTIVARVLEHGTGGLNIDGCRVGDEVITTTNGKGFAGSFGGGENTNGGAQHHGRWPANLILSHTPLCVELGERDIKSDSHHPARRGKGGVGTSGHKGQEGLVERSPKTEAVSVWECIDGCPVAELDRQSGTLTSGLMRAGQKTRGYDGPSMGAWKPGEVQNDTYADSGGASRFFKTCNYGPEDAVPFMYVAKPGKKEKFAGVSVCVCEKEAEQAVKKLGDGGDKRGAKALRSYLDMLLDERVVAALKCSVCGKIAQGHPTQKPVSLMRYLCRLVTPPNGVVLDPFAGSGTTLVAATLEGFRSLGIELTPEYLPIIRGRLAWAVAEAEKAIEGTA